MRVGKLIEELSKFDANKIVYLEDTAESEMVKLEKVYVIKHRSDSELSGQIYLSMEDYPEKGR